MRFEEFYHRATKYMVDVDVWKKSTRKCLEAYACNSKNPKYSLKLILENTNSELTITGDMFKTQLSSTLNDFEPFVKKTLMEIKTEKGDFPNIMNIFDITFPRVEMDSMLINTPINDFNFDEVIPNKVESLEQKLRSPPRNAYLITNTPLTHPNKNVSDLSMNQPVKAFTANNLESVTPFPQPSINSFPKMYAFAPGINGPLTANGPTPQPPKDYPIKIDPVFRQSIDSNQMNQMLPDSTPFMKKPTIPFGDSNSFATSRPFSTIKIPNHPMDNNSNLGYGLPANRQQIPDINSAKDLSQQAYASNQNTRRPSQNVIDSAIFQNDENLLVEMSLGEIPGLTTDQSINFKQPAQSKPSSYHDPVMNALMNEVFNMQPTAPYTQQGHQTGAKHRFSQPICLPSANTNPIDNFRDSESSSMNNQQNTSVQWNPQKPIHRYSSTLGNAQNTQPISKSKSRDKDSVQNKLGKKIDLRHQTPQTDQKLQSNAVNTQFMLTLQGLKTQKLSLIDLSECGNLIRNLRLAH